MLLLLMKLHLCRFIISINFSNIHFDLLGAYTVYLSSTPLLYFNVNYYGGQIFCDINGVKCLQAAAVSGILLTFGHRLLYVSFRR